MVHTAVGRTLLRRTCYYPGRRRIVRKNGRYYTTFGRTKQSKTKIPWQTRTDSWTHFNRAQPPPLAYIIIITLRIQHARAYTTEPIVRVLFVRSAISKPPVCRRRA